MIPQVVWFKRDFRMTDHAPLADAASEGPVIALVIVEPAYWAGADVSARQWSVLSGAIEALRESLAALGVPLQVAFDEAIPTLAFCLARLGSFVLRSHEETGNAWTWRRDRAVSSWCRENGIPWQQSRQFGVWRGRDLNRDRWADRWDRLMRQSVRAVPQTLQAGPALFGGRLPAASELGLAPDGWAGGLAMGREAALARLDSFLHERGERYTREMSSPVTAETACSRLSQDLALGTVSMREVTQIAWARMRDLADAPDGASWRQSLRSFTGRLHWHCHFIQKLDAEPEAESRPFARAYEGLRPRPGRADRLEAWARGCTGYPFLDAAMRYLNATGWINFRMRAMLMSFAAYDLWLPWQEAGLHLARQFVDYEPGIHWPQCQMQAGETGINTVRIYSPVKQGRDQDPDGDFVRRWVPELARVPGAIVHEPWRLVPGDRARLCPAYPAPIVDHLQAAAAAKTAIFGLRRKPDARAEADAVQRKHGSRRRRAPPRTPPSQGELF